MLAFEVGMPVISKAGHDRKKVFIVVDVNDEYAFIADGKSRTVGEPKKKKLMHLQPVCKIPDAIGDLLKIGSPITDEAIRKAIGGLQCQKQM